MNTVTLQELKEIKKFSNKEIEIIKEGMEERDMEMYAEIRSTIADAYIEETGEKVDRLTYELCYRVRIGKFFAKHGK